MKKDHAPPLKWVSAKYLAGYFQVTQMTIWTWAKNGKLPPEDITALKLSGYLKLNIPKQYGGLELSLRDCTEAQLELAQGSASTALVTAMQLQVFGAARDCKTWTDDTYVDFGRVSCSYRQLRVTTVEDD